MKNQMTNDITPEELVKLTIAEKRKMFKRITTTASSSRKERLSYMLLYDWLQFKKRIKYYRDHLIILGVVLAIVAVTFFFLFLRG